MPSCFTFSFFKFGPGPDFTPIQGIRLVVVYLLRSLNGTLRAFYRVEHCPNFRFLRDAANLHDDRLADLVCRLMADKSTK
jgi:hypothetical protein